jgi:integrase
MSIFKRGKIYWYKFMWNGEMVRESTKQGSDKKARNIESAHRTRLSKQEDARKDACSRLRCPEVLLCDECEKWFSAEEARREAEHVFCSDSCSAAWTKRHTRVPTLAQFFKDDFLPYVKTHFTTKPKTAGYYAYGASQLLAADLGAVRLDEITSQHATGFTAKNAKRSASTVNCGLRTLRRALKLAEEWGKLERAPKLALAKGERQRDRIVTEMELLAYRDLCRQPWRDVVTVLYGTGMRPGEAYKLRWEHVLLEEQRGMIQIAEGKTKAARRFLPMLPEVLRAMQARHKEQKSPAEGWVFPAGSKSGHLEESSAKHYHGEVIAKLEGASAAYKAWEENESEGDWKDAVTAATKLEPEYLTRHAAVIVAGLKAFEPYCLRHSALTRLAENGCDAFTLARIAGHSSITITQRYCHPQADAIERAFGKLAGGHNFRHTAETPELEAPVIVSASNSEDES